jgi:hypothetical protein
MVERASGRFVLVELDAGDDDEAGVELVAGMGAQACLCGERR